MTAGLTLQRALMGTVVAAILVGLVPAGFALDRRLVTALIVRAQSDLQMAPQVLADRTAARAEALRMYASDFARAPGLAEAVARRDTPAVHGFADSIRPGLAGGEPLVIAADGGVIVGPTPNDEWVEATRRGSAGVSVGADSSGVFRVALAPLRLRGRWAGAAGVADPLDASAADALARLTRSDVTILMGGGDSIAVSTLDTAAARRMRDAFREGGLGAAAREVDLRDDALLAVATPIANAGHVIFSRSRAAELGIVPELQRVALWSALLALGAAILLGAILSSRLSRPVRELSDAATAMGQGRFDAPLPRSRISEVARVAERFEDMRQTLDRRMAELRSANEALADRNARLVTLQADLMQRDRLAATGRLVGHLAHEIRNPVANLRNLLELIQRRLVQDPATREYADLAIDELLRMHELAEQMLDLNRPRDPGAQRCLPLAVAREVARLALAGDPDGAVRIAVVGDAAVGAAMSPDALKQVLVNLVQNAREALSEAGSRGGSITMDVRSSGHGVTIVVRDDGPGVPAELQTRIFDPFFTTKNEVDGVGLGLFVAEGLVRSAGGRLTVQHAAGGGAQFTIELAHPPRPSSGAAALAEVAVR